MKEGSKYQPLQNYLRSSKEGEVILAFQEIEEILNKKLPKSARTQRSWWSNCSGMLHALAWMQTDYRVENVDLEQETITFRQPIDYKQIKYQDGKVVWDKISIKVLRFHMKLTQAQFAEYISGRQQTVSEWENGIYEPTRAMCKLLDFIARDADFLQ